MRLNEERKRKDGEERKGEEGKGCTYGKIEKEIDRETGGKIDCQRRIDGGKKRKEKEV